MFADSELNPVYVSVHEICIAGATARPHDELN